MRMLKFPAVILLVTWLCTTTGPVQAEQLFVRAGLWETTVTSTNTLMPDPVTNTSTVCFEDGIYEPETMLEGVQECDLESSSVSNGRLGFAMNCTIQGATAKVAGTYDSAGDTGAGDMTVDMQMGPVVMNITMEWTSSYLGECTEG